MTAPTATGRYDPDDPSLRYGASIRHTALTAATAGIRVRRGRGIPVEQILLGAAAVLFPLGVALILLGWAGASHTGHLYEQVDYLISGGLLGIALSGAGGFMYFGYWLSRQLTESRRQSGLTLQSLQRIEELLEAAMVAAPEPNGRALAGPRPAPGPVLLATPRGSLLHRPGCPVVAKRDDLREIRAGTAGFGYCTMCNAAEVPA